MSSLEIFAIVVGLATGYLIVNTYWTGKPSSRAQNSGYTSADADELGKASMILWHEVLGVEPDAPEQDIRAAYKSQISKYHPDKVAALGDELKTLAERKTKDINEAFKEALLARQAQ
ncbi:MAG: J domain-containing protein [Pseudomonadota bacterium]